MADRRPIRCGEKSPNAHTSGNGLRKNGRWPLPTDVGFRSECVLVLWTPRGISGAHFAKLREKRLCCLSVRQVLRNI